MFVTMGISTLAHRIEMGSGVNPPVFAPVVAGLVRLGHRIQLLVGETVLFHVLVDIHAIHLSNRIPQAPKRAKRYAVGVIPIRLPARRPIGSRTQGGSC